MFIYVIASLNSVKIGYSADPKRRLGQLQVGHDQRLTLVYTEAVDPEQGPLLEKRIHQAIRHRCRRGEWFDITHDQAIREVQFAVIRFSPEDSGA